jgi:hypothetical protein
MLVQQQPNAYLLDVACARCLVNTQDFVVVLALCHLLLLLCLSIQLQAHTTAMAHTTHQL